MQDQSRDSEVGVVIRLRAGLLVSKFSHGIRGYTSVMATPKFIYFLNKMNNVSWKIIAELL